LRSLDIVSAMSQGDIDALQTTNNDSQAWQRERRMVRALAIIRGTETFLVSMASRIAIADEAATRQRSKK